MADILIGDISNGSISTGADNKYIWTGSGIFDKLMIAVNGNIKVQFDNGHINTADYANVYLGALQSAIQSSMDFLLKEKLTEEQISASIADTEIKQAQSAADIELKNEQIAASQAETAIRQAQSAKDLLVKQAQIDEADKKVLLMSEQIAASQAETLVKQEQSAADIALKEEQALLVAAQTTTEASNNTVKTNQATLLTKQGMLVDRQKEGFNDDAKGKLLKQVMDSWAVGFSVSQTDISVPDSIKVNVLDSITSNIMTGLNITKRSDPLGES